MGAPHGDARLDDHGFHGPRVPAGCDGKGGWVVMKMAVRRRALVTTVQARLRGSPRVAGAEGGVGGGQAGERDPVRRARDVVEADLVEELHRRRVSAMLAADPELEVGASLAPVRDGVL